MSAEIPNTPELPKAGGTILTRILIYERPDLLAKCPEQVQKAIRLYHDGNTHLQNSDFNKARELIHQSFQVLIDKP
ncbi:MAG: hypothetical protein UT21_C0002G0021 [Candidatus Woesebacteria bacterium GW2011_GWA1_39_11b]|nr:MAG: hypothetical protein UT21_C0002G0021 [Candidatus Woesebacteria bacterium GW2011_GWA1_39_11b]KKS78434.1 MAG: hypothetical protein UV51_C0001G0150 [Candidatus Woesebacteria bacterium GW2011_GWC1_42_9]